VRALHDAVKEVEEGVRHFRELEGRQPGQDELVPLHELRQESSLLAQALSLVNVAAESEHLFTQCELLPIRWLLIRIQPTPSCCQSQHYFENELENCFRQQMSNTQSSHTSSHLSSRWPAP
jgi:hypothetical protein